MEIILLEDVKTLGKKGQIVKVSDGYGRNIIAKKLGLEATAKNLNDLKLQKQNADKVAANQLAEAKALAEKLAELSVTVSIKAGEGGRLFGSVTSKEVAAEISKQFAVKVDKRKISMDDIKTFGSYKIEVKLYTNIVAEMTVMVGE